MLKLKRGLEHSCQKKFILEALQSGIRPDGRDPTESRDVKIEFHPIRRGQVNVSLGSTEVLCILTGEIVKPLEHRPYDGFIYFNVDMSPMAIEQNDSSRSLSSPTFVRSQEVTALIETILRRSRALDTEGLYIEAGSRVWCLTVDLHVLNDDGNVIDAAALATLAAFLHFRRDKTLEYQGTSVRTEGMPSSPLSIHHLPVLVSLSLMTDSRHSFLVDPTRQEECICVGQMTIAINQFEELCGIHKSGGEPLSHETLRYAIRTAACRASSLIDSLLNSLKSHEAKRQERMKNVWNTYGTTQFPTVRPQASLQGVDWNLLVSLELKPKTSSDKNLQTVCKTLPESEAGRHNISNYDLYWKCNEASEGFLDNEVNGVNRRDRFEYDPEESHDRNEKIVVQNSNLLIKDVLTEKVTTESDHDENIKRVEISYQVEATLPQSSTEDFSEAILQLPRKCRTKKRKTKPL